MEKLLSSIAREWTDRLEAEVIVVGTDSTDSSQSAPSMFAGRLPIRHVVGTLSDLGQVRNFGAREATSDYVLYLDGQAILGEGYLDCLEIVLRRFEPDIVGGPVMPRLDQPLPAWFEPEMDMSLSEPRSGYTVTGDVSFSNICIRRALVFSLGGFALMPFAGVDAMLLSDADEIVERYRKATSSSGQRVYYAIELLVRRPTAPLKLSKRYQYQREYAIAQRREIALIRDGGRSVLASMLLAMARFTYFPVFVFVLAARERAGDGLWFNVGRRWHVICGQLTGALRVAFGASFGPAQ